MNCPWLTADLPGTGGIFKALPEDFEVEELPAYLPCGQGDHLFLWIEKVGIESEAVANALAETLKIPRGDIGYAGQKDRRAICRQFFSVPAKVSLTEFPATGPFRLLSSQRHGNKLRTGHLKGNRFKIRVREATSPQAAGPILSRLAEQGMPNFFGSQRFGLAGGNADFGRRLLKGERLSRKPSRFERKLFLSAFQSLLFNQALAQRVAEGSLSQALPGDVLRKDETGGLFVCEDVREDQPRVQAFEVSAAGPMFGPKMLPAKGEVAVREAALLIDAGMDPSDFRRGGEETEGTRRAYRVRPGALSWELEGSDLSLSFELPRGSYATTLLGEVMKTY